MIYRLANGDILRMSDATKVTVNEAFTFISYETDMMLEDKIKIDGNSH